MSSLPSKKILDDLYTRFVVNGPEEEKQSLNRLMFLVESAHWYYEDNVVENDKTLKSLSFGEFTRLLFNNSDALRPHVGYMDMIFRDFFSYKSLESRSLVRLYWTRHTNVACWSRDGNNHRIGAFHEGRRIRTKKMMFALYERSSRRQGVMYRSCLIKKNTSRLHSKERRE
ncbi:unnamed protein product [Brassica napus]|uniref:(rape) hypothetical protein n=1 Tax=Brassica napus TaxID=3708 RepID=A0A816JSD9_BRANA|nr:unnamed protein product [Brassica napus]